MLKPILYFFLQSNKVVLNALKHASCVNTIHTSYSLFCFVFCFFFFFFFSCLSFPILSIMVRKTRAHRTSTSSSTPSFDSERFISEKNQEIYKKLNILRSMWAERKVVLDELDLEIRKNFDRRGWLPLMDIDHPPP